VAAGSGGPGDRVVERRAFLGAVTGGLLAAARPAEGQQAGKVFRIGATVATDAFYDAFVQRLGELGWVPGQNAVVERRTTRGERARVGAIVAELIALNVDVILGSGSWIMEMTQKYRLPTISPFISFADAGTLMAYGPSLPEMYRRAAIYVDKILRSAK